mmetsp:Transcript_39202/g.63637  ORF Transcript_39202/g.63637 Transcript_39202/m.63637 type:complete len:108 (-) Transcript_39202:92-415(-)
MMPCQEGHRLHLKLMIRSATYACKDRQMVSSSIVDILCATPVARGSGLHNRHALCARCQFYVLKTITEPANRTADCICFVHLLMCIKLQTKLNKNVCYGYFHFMYKC